MTTWDIEFVINKIGDNDVLTFVIDSADGYVYSWCGGDYVYIPREVLKKKGTKLSGKQIKILFKKLQNKRH